MEDPSTPGSSAPVEDDNTPASSSSTDKSPSPEVDFFDNLNPDRWLRHAERILYDLLSDIDAFETTDAAAIVTIREFNQTVTRKLLEVWRVDVTDAVREKCGRVGLSILVLKAQWKDFKEQVHNGKFVSW